MTTSLSMVDVAIGLVVVYLLLSLLCSSAHEGIEALLRNRARQLERGIREILDDPDGTKITQLIYNHPLITGLFRGGYNPQKVKPGRWSDGNFYRGRNLPSYIPATNFALAVMDVILPATAAHPGGTAMTLQPMAQPEPDVAEAFRQAALNFPVASVGRSLVILTDASGHDLMRIREGIEAWYNSTMDRVSGWYKRRTQLILFAIALSIAASLNIDSVNITSRLATDPSLRNSLVVTAQEYARGAATIPANAQQVQENLSRLETLGIPIGWDRAPKGAYLWFLKIAGILASTLAATLGAPFWFDVLNRFMVIRSTIKPQEKSREEQAKG